MWFGTTSSSGFVYPSLTKICWALGVLIVFFGGYRGYKQVLDERQSNEPDTIGEPSAMYD